MRHALLAVGLLVPLLSAQGPGPRLVRVRDPLTFAQRVEAQRAIEAVYQRHRLGGDRPLAEAVPDALLRRKVRDALARSAMLARRWKMPITDGMLRDEMARIRAHTRRPEMLREVESALGNDELVLRETLARESLSERLIQDRFARDQRTEGGVRTQMESQYDCDKVNTWTALSTQGAPSPRALHTAVWTGAEMIVWGGRYPASGVGLASGALYDPMTDSWRATSMVGAPAARYSHVAVWTGSRMIVWGGNPGLLNSGGRYDPVADTWEPTTLTGAPSGRVYHTAVWTGNEMIVWGGFGAQATGLASGGRYDPVADQWSPTSTSGAPAGRIWHTSAWTGDEMIVWGGAASSNAQPMDTGGRYDPASDTWQETALRNAPSARVFASAVWTGSEMIVWGGSFLDDGGIYDPGLDTWRPLSTLGAPARRAGHTAVWTGRLMAVWGGSIALTGPDDTGGLYDPVADVWTLMSTDNAPTARKWHTAVMASSEMIVWGGADANETLNATGAAYGLDVSPDADGDGVTICGGDCDDTDPQVGGKIELPGNRKDENCDGVLLCDPDTTWSNPGAFRLCVANACKDLARQGLVTPPQCLRQIVGIPEPH